MMKAKLLLATATVVFMASIPREEPVLLRPNSIEGRWEALTICPGFIFEFRQGKFDIYDKSGRLVTSYKCKLDPDRSPAQMDFGVGHAIYIVNGDSMMYCIVPPGGARPSEFKEVGGATLYKFKRKSQ